MPEKEIVLIPKLKRIKREIKKTVKAGEYLIIFPLWLVLLVLIVYLPLDSATRILSLLIGSFILEDIHHSLKSG